MVKRLTDVIAVDWAALERNLDGDKLIAIIQILTDNGAAPTKKRRRGPTKGKTYKIGGTPGGRYTAPVQRTRVSDDQAREIRGQWVNGAQTKASAAAIARRFRISDETMRRIIRCEGRFAKFLKAPQGEK